MYRRQPTPVETPAHILRLIVPHPIVARERHAAPTPHQMHTIKYFRGGAVSPLGVGAWLPKPPPCNIKSPLIFPFGGTYAVISRREVWRDCVPPKSCFLAYAGDFVASIGKKEVIRERLHRSRTLAA
jgi:hypothetical protein